MPNPGGLPARLSEAVETYVRMRGKDQMISLKRLVRATQFMMPEFEITEKELADMIASKLVELNCNIVLTLPSHHLGHPTVNDGPSQQPPPWTTARRVLRSERKKPRPPSLATGEGDAGYDMLVFDGTQDFIYDPEAGGFEAVESGSSNDALWGDARRT